MSRFGVKSLKRTRAAALTGLIEAAVIASLPAALASFEAGFMRYLLPAGFRRNSSIGGLAEERKGSGLNPRIFRG